MCVPLSANASFLHFSFAVSSLSIGHLIHDSRPRTTFFGNERNASGAGASGHVVLCQIILAVLAPVLVSYSLSPLVLVGHPENMQQTETQKTHLTKL